METCETLRPLGRRTSDKSPAVCTSQGDTLVPGNLGGGKIQGRETSRFPGNMVKAQALPAFSHKPPFSAPLKSAIRKSLTCPLAPSSHCSYGVRCGGLTQGGLTRFHGPRQTPTTLLPAMLAPGSASSPILLPEYSPHCTVQKLASSVVG